MVQATTYEGLTCLHKYGLHNLDRTHTPQFQCVVSVGLNDPRTMLCLSPPSIHEEPVLCTEFVDTVQRQVHVGLPISPTSWCLHAILDMVEMGSQHLAVRFTSYQWY